MIARPIVIAGTHSGVGKTTVTAGLMAALSSRGLRVQGFKAGPDFIDPGFHRAATGRPAHNLDSWILSRETNLAIFDSAVRDADIAIVEGVMGLFDGKDAASLSGTTAELALWLDAAVLLVVDASAMAGSVAAIVNGFDSLLPDLRIAAVICNRIGGPGHYRILHDAIAARCQAEPIGYLPREAALEIPERHLGLHLAAEVLTAERLEALAAAVAANIHLDRLLDLSRCPHDIPGPAAPAVAPHPPRTRIGIARDAAFCFYYQANLDLLEALGAELVEFSPISAPSLPPDLGGLYLGGGYPELHAEALSSNTAMRAAVARFAQSGAPVYAECGGFMYLTEAIIAADGREYPMVGLFPTRARMHPRLAALGYLEAEACRKALWLEPGERLRGHEFRYSQIDPVPPSVERALRLHGAAREEGYLSGSVLAGYAHLHFRSAPEFAARFVGACTNHCPLQRIA